MTAGKRLKYAKDALGANSAVEVLRYKAFIKRPEGQGKAAARAKRDLEASLQYRILTPNIRPFPLCFRERRLNDFLLSNYICLCQCLRHLPKLFTCGTDTVFSMSSNGMREGTAAVLKHNSCYTKANK